MTRKAKGKFRLPGIQGRGFKMTGSAPFKVKSSFKQDEDTNTEELGDWSLDNLDAEEKEDFLESLEGSAIEPGQSGVDYFSQELSKWARRKKKDSKSEKLKDQEEKYDAKPDEEFELDPRGLNEDDLRIYESNPRDFDTNTSQGLKDLQRYRELHGFDENYNWLEDEDIIKGDFDENVETYEGGDTEKKETVEEEETSYYTPSDETSIETTSEPKVSYEGTTKNEMYDLRRPFKEDGTWDPDSKPEHAAIQNRINELHGSDKRYDAGPVDNTALVDELGGDFTEGILPHHTKWNKLNDQDKQKLLKVINEDMGQIDGEYRFANVQELSEWLNQGGQSYS